MENLPITWATLAYFGSALMAGAAILHWIYRELNSLREAISAVLVVIAKEYVSNEKLRLVEDRIESTLLRIEERIDTFLNEQLRRSLVE